MAATVPARHWRKPSAPWISRQLVDVLAHRGGHRGGECRVSGADVGLGRRPAIGDQRRIEAGRRWRG